jgi:hypothetical protein
MPPELLSPHHLQSWERCARQFELKYVRKLDWPTETGNFALGQTVHKLMDFHARQLPLDSFLNGDDIAAHTQALLAHPLAQLPVVASEWGFQVPITPNGWLTGRIDRIAKEPETQTLWVIDWKTGTGVPANPESAWQTVCYLYAVTEACADLGLPDLTADHVKFAYLKASNRGEARQITVPYHRGRHQETRQRLEQAFHSILGAMAYPLPEHCPDRYCPYRRVCGIAENSL